LVTTHASDHSLTYDRDSVFSHDDPSGTTETEVSGTFESPNLQDTGTYWSEIFKESGQCIALDMDDLDDGIERVAMFTSDWNSVPVKKLTDSLPKISEANATQVQNLKSVKLVVGASSDTPRTSPADSEQVACRSGRSEPSVKIRPRSPPPCNDCEDFQDVFTGNRQVLPPLGQCLIDSLNAKLDPEMRLHYWANFFSRWEGIIEVLKSRRYNCTPKSGY
jgi:hypothetical protein